MTLETGLRLGRYEIISQLGEGGMGEVSRARDDRLDRDVAIKVLPEEDDAELTHSPTLTAQRRAEGRLPQRRRLRDVTPKQQRIARCRYPERSLSGGL